MDSLLSGLIGAVIAVSLTIAYKEFKEKKQKEVAISKERLGHIYGPLFLIVNYKKTQFTGDDKIVFTDEEQEYIAKLILENYYLIEEKRKPAIFDLYRKISVFKNGSIPVIQEIEKGYFENMKKAGM